MYKGLDSIRQSVVVEYTFIESEHFYEAEFIVNLVSGSMLGYEYQMILPTLKENPSFLENFTFSRICKII